MTTYMGMQLATPQTTTGPLWAQMINDALEVLDAHDHTSGNGAPISWRSITVDGDVDLDEHRMIGVKNIRPAANTATPAFDSDDFGVIYSVAGELYWRDGQGNSVQITASGGVSGTSGAITNMGTDQAVVYSDLADAMLFVNNTADYSGMVLITAGMDIYPATADMRTGNRVRIQADDVSESYVLQLPAETPDALRLVTFDEEGYLGVAAVPAKRSILQVGTDGVPLYAAVPTAGTALMRVSSSGVISYVEGSSMAPGAVPIGGIVPVMANMTGAWVPPTGADVKDGYMLCNGSTISEQTLQGTTPNLTDERFLMGHSVAGTTGGTNAKDLSHTHVITDHYHTLGTSGYAAIGFGVASATIANFYWKHSGTNSAFTNQQTSFIQLTAGAGGTTTGGTGGIITAAIGGRTDGITSTPVSTGSSGSSTQNILPQYLTCIYVIRVA